MSEMYLTLDELAGQIKDGKTFQLVEPFCDERQNILIGTEKILNPKDVDKVLTRFPHLVTKPIRVLTAIPHYIPEEQRIKWTAYLISMFEQGPIFKNLPRIQKDFVVKYLKTLLVDNDYVIWKLSQIKNYSKKVFVHSSNVCFIAMITYFSYNTLNFQGMIDAKAVDEVIISSLLHDVGMMKADARMVEKKRIELSDAEMTLFYSHATEGFKAIQEENSRHQIAREALLAIMNHEERVDGTGGPRGVNGEDITFLARLLSLSDYFELLTSHEWAIRPRPYRDYIGKIRAEKKKFDEKLVEALDMSFKHLFSM